MRKLPPYVASGLCLLIVGCQTPMFSDGLFSSLNPQKTLTTEKASSSTDRSISATKPRIGGRGWRNASTRAAETRAKAPAIGINNVGRLREFLAKGNDSMQKGLYDDARIQYETVLSIEPHHATAHHMLGRISDMSKQFEEAERHYLEALSANREDGYLLSDLGYSYLQQGRLGEARQYLMQAVTREPNLAIAKVNLAAAYAYAGDPKGALAWLRQVGTEQQAQETLAGITSKPAPWIINRANGSLAETGPTIDNNGDVIGSNGQTLKTWQEVQAEMKRLRTQGTERRQAEGILNDYEEDLRVKQAIAAERAYDAQSAARNNDANLNQQMRDIEQASGSNRRRPANSGVIHIGPPGQQNGASQSNAPGQFQPQGNGNAAPQPGWNPQGQLQQFQNGGPTGGGIPQGQNPSQQNPYAHLLNPAGPMAVPSQQPVQPRQQTPPILPNVQGSSVPPQFPGSAYRQSQPPNALAVPQNLAPNQYQAPNLNSGPPNGASPQGQPAQASRQYGDNVYPGTNPAFEWSAPQNVRQIQPSPQHTAPQRLSPDAVPRDQYGNPIQSLAPTNPAWNGQPGTAQPAVTQPRQGNSAPGPGFYGQSGASQNVAPSAGTYDGSVPQLNTQPSQVPPGQFGQPNQFPAGNRYYSQGQSSSPNQLPPVNRGNDPQQIQQLGFTEPQPMARIDRGQRIQQYSEADRQAMRLGMAAGSGALAPLNTNQSQTQQQEQQSGNGTPQNNFVPNGPPHQPANIQNRNSGVSYYDHQSGQTLQQPQQFLGRELPGAVPSNSERNPGQASMQAPIQQIHGQSLADQMGLDPQTAQPWLRMPTSQTDVTRPVAFSNSTQPAEQRSANWQQPGLNNQPWQNQVLASPTTQASFGQPHMTNPHLRPANSQNEQPANVQAVQTASWPSQQ